MCRAEWSSSLHHVFGAVVGAQERSVLSTLDGVRSIARGMSSAEPEIRVII